MQASVKNGFLHETEDLRIIMGPTTAARLHAPLVSVIMNCYNSAKHLREALESVQTQMFADWEIVFWDNRSTDESAAIFKSFHDPRFRYFLAPGHTPLGMAKSLVIEQARGEWLAFLDCDDLWLPRKLERQLALISEEGPDLGLVYGRMDMFVEEEAKYTPMGRSAQAANRRGSHNKVLPDGNIFANLLKENIIPQPSAMVRHAAYRSVGGIDRNLRHAWDYDLFVKLSREFRARAVQEIVCTYRIHSSNLSHVQAAVNYEEAMAIVSRYLPAREARLGIRSQETHFAVSEMRLGRISDGLWRVLVHGDIVLFVRKFAAYLWQYFISRAQPFIGRGQ